MMLIMHRMIDEIQNTAISEMWMLPVVKIRITRDIRMLNTRPLNAFDKKDMRRYSQLQMS